MTTALLIAIPPTVIALAVLIAVLRKMGNIHVLISAQKIELEIQNGKLQAALAEVQAAKQQALEAKRPAGTKAGPKATRKRG